MAIVATLLLACALLIAALFGLLAVLLRRKKVRKA